MKSGPKKLLSVIICLFIFAGVLPVGAAENTAGLKHYGLNTYLSPVGSSPTGAIVAGDVNGDGETDNKDLTRLFQHLSNWDVEVNRAALDVNGDQSIDNKDLTRLFQYLSNWDVVIFPEPIACEHDGDTEIRDAKEPTCTNEGYTGDTYCLLCGSLLSTGDTIPVIPHTGGTATCHTKAVCEVCGTQYGEFDAENHSGGTEIRNGYPASCIRGGYTGDTYCLGCEAKLREGEYSEPSGIHINTEVVGAIEPTCVSSGYTGDIVCLDCGTTVEYGTHLDIVNEHVHTEIKGDRKPTCLETGYTGDLVCTDCGALIEAGSLIDPTGHLNTEIRDVTPATCKAGGYTGNTYCLDCGMLIEQGTYTDPTGIHVNTEIRDDSPATCMIGGYTGNTYCLDCGMLIEQGNYIDPTGHLNTEIRGEVPATCMTDGHTGDLYCLDCGELIMSGEPIPATGHINTEVRDAILATCEAEGYSGDTYCLDCGELIMPGTVIEPTGHIGDNATYYSKAVCDVCGAEFGDYAQMLVYDLLNENQKGIYRIIEETVYNLELGYVSVFEYCDPDTYEYDITVAFRAVSHDRPDLFWMPKQIYIPYSYNTRTGEITNVYIYFNDNESDSSRGLYGITSDERVWMVEVLEQKLLDAVNATIGLETNFEKEIAIHNYLCQLISYDYYTAGSVPGGQDATSNPTGTAGGYYNKWSFTAYGALANGMAVCEGYSRAMQLICQRLGIPCGLVTGLGNGGAHMWNIINPGDGCYYLDVTFDDTAIDSKGYDMPCIYTYFNRTKSDMEEDHIFDDLYEQGAPLLYYDSDYDVYYEIEYNFFDTHGDNTELEYYNATGAYIDSNDATDAANYVMYHAYNSWYSQIAVKFDPEFGYRNAYKALERALNGKIRLDSSYNILGDDLIVVKILR